MKCNRSRPGFELVSPCPFPTTITITPRALPVSARAEYDTRSIFKRMLILQVRVDQGAMAMKRYAIFLRSSGLGPLLLSVIPWILPQPTGLEDVFTKTEMNNKRNVNFLQNTKHVQKNIETEAVVAKTEMNNELNVNFLRNEKSVQRVLRLKLHLSIQYE